VQRTPGLPDQEYVVPANPTAAGPLCHDFTLPVTVSGRVVTANGRACLLPDGSWQVVQNTPGLPVQSYTVPPPAAAAATQSVPPEYWGWAPWPWYFGLGPSFVLIERHHFHHHPMPMPPAIHTVAPPTAAPPPAMHRR
jgi:hypothetical protein